MRNDTCKHENKYVNNPSGHQSSFTDSKNSFKSIIENSLPKKITNIGSFTKQGFSFNQTIGS